MTTLEQVIGLYERRGAAMYGGERVTQLEHALQCAGLAQREGAGDELVAAAFLHDLGHLLSPDTEIHEYLALPFLRPLFGDEVLAPIKLHVDAKRYLCFAEKAYWEALSDESKRSLQAQGGPFDARHAQEFIERRFARDAVKLRTWDDLAKVPGARAPALGEMAGLLQHVTGCHKTAIRSA